MSRFHTIALAFVAYLPILLGGCSALGLDATPSGAGDDIPDASSLDQQKSQTLYLAVINGLRDQGKPQAALAYLDEFDKQYKDMPYAALLRAECLVDIGKYQEAQPVFAVLLKGPFAAAANAGLGNIAAVHDDWDHAANRFREANQLQPSHAEYANDLGFAEIRLGDYSGGIDMLSRAAELAPNNRFIRNNLILGLHLAGQNQRAERVIDGIVDPNERKQAKKLLLVSAKALVAQTPLPSKAEPSAPPPKMGSADTAEPAPTQTGR